MSVVQLIKKDVDKMMLLEGNVRGSILKAQIDLIREKKGEAIIKKVAEKMKELGHPFDFANINITGWYPEALSCLIILICAEICKCDEKQVFEMGYEASKYSFFVKLLMQYFLNIEKVFNHVPGYWRKHFDFSEMEVAEFNNKERYGILRLKNFQKYHPLICEYHKGYFTKIAEMTLGKKTVKVEHPKCLFRGDSYEEFKISWE